MVMPKLHAFLFFRSSKIQTHFISCHEEIDLSSHQIKYYQHLLFHLPLFIDGSGAGRKLRVPLACGVYPQFWNHEMAVWK